MLHAVALAELEDLDSGQEHKNVQCFQMELVDAGAISPHPLKKKPSAKKPEEVFSGECDEFA